MLKLMIQNTHPKSHQDGEALGGLQLFQLLQVLHDGRLPGRRMMMVMMVMV